MSHVEFQELQEYVSQHLHVAKDKLKPTTRLLHDLQVDGDDAYEFMEGFGKHFGVNMDRFQIRRHFGSELESGVRWVLQKVLGPHKLGYKPITMQQLLDAVRCGAWNAKSDTS
jgi:hypothetical protein